MESESSPGTGPEDTVVVCPECRRATDHLKIYPVVYFYFLVFVWGWHNGRHVACPTCMRLSLVGRLIGLIPLANIFYPIVAMQLISQLLMTRAEGHSDPVAAEEFRMSRAEYKAWEEADRARPKPKVWVFFLFLALGVGISIAGYFVMKWREGH